jgi:hypothetical protein
MKSASNLKAYSLSMPSIAAMLLMSGSLLAQQDYVPARTEHGQPDLQGIWTNATQTPLERPRELGEKRFFTEEERNNQEQEWLDYIADRSAQSDPDRAPPTDGDTDLGYNNFWVDRGTQVNTINGEYRTSLIVEPADGRIPYAEGSRERMMARFASMGYDGPEGRPLGERCLMSFGSHAGPPMLPVMYNNNYQIVQTKDYVMILAEMVHDARIIPLNKAASDHEFPKWLGNSVGYWEGDTLVVETRNIRSEQLFRGATEALVITERFSRVADNEIVYSFTLDDPVGYSRPWTGEIQMKRRPAESAQMYEYACHEGNYALSGILAGARQQEVNATETAN